MPYDRLKRIITLFKMSVSTKVYTLGKMKQLIDLNGDVVNFRSTFKATSTGGESFYAIAVDQKTLDNGEELQYKHAEKSISGTIVSDSGIYQNYFLILKSDVECECTVEIKIEEVDQKVNNTSAGNNENFARPSPAIIPVKTATNWKPYLIVFVLIVAAVLIWYFWKKKNQGIENVSIPDIPDITPSVMPSVTPSTLPSVTHSVKPSLLERLNGIKI